MIANTTTRALRPVMTRTVVNQRRHAGHFLKKNLYVEENAGIRENSYKTWTFTPSNVLTMTALLVVPGFLFYYGVIGEMRARDANTGKTQDYGFLPKL
eukprot:gene8974-9906_t